MAGAVELKRANIDAETSWDRTTFCRGSSARCGVSPSGRRSNRRAGVGRTRIIWGGRGGDPPLTAEQHGCASSALPNKNRFRGRSAESSTPTPLLKLRHPRPKRTRAIPITAVRTSAHTQRVLHRFTGVSCTVQDARKTPLSRRSPIAETYCTLTHSFVYVRVCRCDSYVFILFRIIICYSTHNARACTPEGGDGNKKRTLDMDHFPSSR